VESRKKQKVTPEIVVEILKKHDSVISVNDAGLILDFMYSLAKLALQQQVTNEKSRSICESKH
jgi:hypothetical protein